MEKLLELARKSCGAATVYRTSGKSTSVSFEDGSLKNVSSSMRTGTRLVVVNEGRLGFAYTTNLLDREASVASALLSAGQGPKANAALPGPEVLPELDAYDASAEAVETSRLVDECVRAIEILKERIPGKTQIEAESGLSIREIRLVNSLGVSYRARLSSFHIGCACLYPASASSVSDDFQALTPSSFPEERIEALAELYSSSLPEIKVPSGRTRVIFLPDAFYALAWRVAAGVNAKNVYQGISPVAGRIGERVLDSRLDFYLDPLDTAFPGARAFDDEGTPCKRADLYGEGRLEGFFADREYASRLGIEPTGSGWAGEVTSLPGPAANRLYLAPGTESLADMLKTMGRGIVAQSILGAHSGNIPNGDFSVGRAPGLVVEDGQVIGRVSDAMLSGNAYEALERVVCLGDTRKPSYGGTFPAVLLDGVPLTIGA